MEKLHFTMDPHQTILTTFLSHFEKIAEISLNSGELTRCSIAYLRGYDFDFYYRLFSKTSELTKAVRCSDTVEDVLCKEFAFDNDLQKEIENALLI